MLSYLANQKYKKKIELIELTKKLEREPCDSLSFTHKLQKNLFPYSKWTDVTFGGQDTLIDKRVYPSFISPTATGTTAQIPSIQNSFATLDGAEPDFYYAADINGDGNSEYSGFTIYRAYSINGSITTETIYSIDSVVNGYNLTMNIPSGADASEYMIEWRLIYKWVSGGYKLATATTYLLAEKPNISTKPIPSITDVINRILDVGVSRSVGQSPKYTLDPVIAAKFANVDAPEFFLPRMTLFEAILSVGNYIHGIPRLVFNENTNKADTITYDLLGLDAKYTIPSYGQIIGYKKYYNADDYCGAFDSYAENVVNTIDQNAGSVTEPYIGGYKTLRTSSGLVIDNDTAVFETERPIYRVVKVEMAFTEGSTRTAIGDITQYVYEQAEYDGLFTSDNATYPNSVAWALCYKQGDRYIKGFNTTSAALLSLIQSFKKQAIVNIANSIINNSMSTANLYGNLAFRVTYVPMDNVRVRQYKPYTGFPNDNVLYNQQNANTVEANYYGENLKGKIARMGNAVEVYTVQFPADTTEENLPKVGNIFAGRIKSDNTVESEDDTMYIYDITTRRERYFIQQDIYLTKDFNRLSEYFGLNSNFRLYEVSEKQSIDRQVNISRIVKVSLTGGYSASAMCTVKGSAAFISTLLQQNVQFDDIDIESNHASVGVFQFYDKNGNKIQNNCFLKAINSTSCGNSLVFSCTFEDSFSAGNRSTYAGAQTGGAGNQTYQWKQMRTSPYGDVYGEFYSMRFCVASKASKTITWEDQKTDGFCDKLPTITEAILSDTAEDHGFFDTGNYYRIVVDKNSSEKISVVLQIHFQATDKSIVLGQALFDENLLIKEAPTSPTVPHWYGLRTETLNQLRQRISVSSADVYDFGAVSASDIYANIIVGQSRIEPKQNTSSEDFIGWAIADPTTGRLYIGTNKEWKSGSSTDTIYFNPDENP